MSTTQPLKVPRGPHPLTQEAVAASQRQRMLGAVIEAVAEKGYAATTVADVIQRAGVSRRTFYEQFSQIEDCFVAAYAAGLEPLQAAIAGAAAASAGRPVQDRVQAVLQAYLQTVAAMPGASWAFAAATVGASERVRDLRAEALWRWVDVWRTLLQQRPGQAAKVHDAELWMLVGGLEELVRETLRLADAQALPGLLPQATSFALAVLRAPVR